LAVKACQEFQVTVFGLVEDGLAARRTVDLVKWVRDKIRESVRGGGAGGTASGSPWRLG
jgi:hypothetical protein